MEREAKRDKKEVEHLPVHSSKKEKSIYTDSYGKCLKIMERMIMQNKQPKMYNNYKYLFTGQEGEAPKENEGFMVALWRFLYPNPKKKAITSIAWNPKYKDLFAVGYGKYDFSSTASRGYIALCTLKNNKSPELMIQTEDDVISLDWHPTSHALLAVGLYNGVVQVYDVRDERRQPIYASSIKTKKHTDPVWQVKWNADISKNFNFYSISSDGRVMNWILMKDKLEPEEVIRLKLINKKNKQMNEETSLISLASGLCFDFNKFEKHQFLVGTEEGNIHLCSKAYSGQYERTYDGH